MDICKSEPITLHQTYEALPAAWFLPTATTFTSLLMPDSLSYLQTVAPTSPLKSIYFVSIPWPMTSSSPYACMFVSLLTGLLLSNLFTQQPNVHYANITIKFKILPWVSQGPLHTFMASQRLPTTHFNSDLSVILLTWGPLTQNFSQLFKLALPFLTPKILSKHSSHNNSLFDQVFSSSMSNLNYYY